MSSLALSALFVIDLLLFVFKGANTQTSGRLIEVKLGRKTARQEGFRLFEERQSSCKFTLTNFITLFFSKHSDFINARSGRDYVHNGMLEVPK